MMMQTPDDKAFRDALSDYAAPIQDDGFTQSVIAQIEKETLKTDRLRRGLIYGACFIGGAIAATQLPAFMKVLSNMSAAVKIDMTVLPSTLPALLPVSQLTILMIVFLGFVLWAALDRTSSELF